MSQFLRAALAGALICSITPTQAEVLVQYGFESTSAPFAPSTILPGVNPSSLTLTPNFVRSGTGSPVGGGNLALQFRFIDEGPAPTDGREASSHFTFKLEPSVAGTALNLDSLSFFSKLNADTTGPGGIFTIQYDDLSDPAGFQLLSPSFLETKAAAQMRTLDLSSPLFDNLTAGITFRINFTEPSGAPTNEENNSMKLDNLTVSGAVIPEPASSALLLAGGVFLARRRRQRSA